LKKAKREIPCLQQYRLAQNYFDPFRAAVHITLSLVRRSVAQHTGLRFLTEKENLQKALTKISKTKVSLGRQEYQTCLFSV